MRRILPPPGQLAAWSALAICVVVVGWSLPIDDFWLSIASGRAIVDGADPAVALPFSWTEEVAGAINPQWGAQVLLGGMGSLSVALALNAALIALSIGLTVMRAAQRASPMAVVLALLLSLAGLAPHLLARAQSFSIALLPLALILLDRFGGRPWLPLAYGVLMVAWANVHGAFVIGQLAAVAWLIAAAARRDALLIPLATVVAAAIAPIANPVGLDLLAYAYRQPATEVVTAISVEWQPSWPWIAITIPFWAIVAAFFTGRLRRVRAPLPDLILGAALAVLAISAVRHIPWFLLIAMPILATDVDHFLNRFDALRRALGQFPARLAGRRMVTTIGLLGVIVLGFQLLRPVLPAGVARLTPDEPAAVVDRLADEVRPGDRVLNEQVWGGYVAHRLWPDLETAMDGRLEIRSRDEWAGYFALMQGRGDPAAELEERGVQWALLGTERQVLRSALELAGWSVVADDGYATLLRAPGSSD